MKKTFCDNCDRELTRVTGVYTVNAVIDKRDGSMLEPDGQKVLKDVDLCGRCAARVREVLEGKEPRVVVRQA